MWIVEKISKLRFLWRISIPKINAFRLWNDSKKFDRIARSHSVKWETNDSIAHYTINLVGHHASIGMRLYSGGDIYIFYEVLWKKVYNIPSNLLQNPKIIVDLGANIGFASLFFADKYRNAQIIAVEPATANFNILQHNVSSFTQIKAIQAAAYTKTGTVAFSEQEHYAYNFKIATGKETSYQVAAVTMPDLMSNCQLTTIDLLKIDIEGAEKELLSKNNDWLNLVKCIIIELHAPYNIDEFKQNLLPFNFKILEPKESGCAMLLAVKQLND